MSILKFEDITKMDPKARTEKMKDLRMELIRAKVGTSKATSKTKEIKRAIARLNTFNKADDKVKQVGKKK